MINKENMENKIDKMINDSINTNVLLSNKDEFVNDLNKILEYNITNYNLYKHNKYFIIITSTFNKNIQYFLNKYIKDINKYRVYVESISTLENKPKYCIKTPTINIFPLIDIYNNYFNDELYFDSSKGVVINSNEYLKRKAFLENITKIKNISKNIYVMSSDIKQHDIDDIYDSALNIIDILEKIKENN